MYSSPIPLHCTAVCGSRTHRGHHPQEPSRQTVPGPNPRCFEEGSWNHPDCFQLHRHSYNLACSAMLQHCSDAEDEHPICFLPKNVGDDAPRDLMARAHCILRQPPSRFSAATPSRMKVMRLALGTVCAFSSPENVRGSEKNRPPTDETRSGFGFLLPSQHPTTSIEQPGTFFHVTIFLWGWPMGSRSRW